MREWGFDSGGGALVFGFLRYHGKQYATKRGWAWNSKLRLRPTGSCWKGLHKSLRQKSSFYNGTATVQAPQVIACSGFSWVVADWFDEIKADPSNPMGGGGGYCSSFWSISRRGILFRGFTIQMGGFHSRGGVKWVKSTSNCYPKPHNILTKLISSYKRELFLICEIFLLLFFPLPTAVNNICRHR